MEYANAKMQAGALGSQIAQRDKTPLESLSGAVQRINSATVTVQYFLNRFHGEEPTTNHAGEQSAEIQAVLPHRDTIDRLFSALDRLEANINQLGQIG